jgi:hypothetical protein
MSLPYVEQRFSTIVMSAGGWQPASWPYHPPPTSYHVHNRHWSPPKALPWYYTCDPLYLLYWIAVRVIPTFTVIGAVWSLVFH